MSTKPHDPEIRAAATAALLAGQSVSSVAREYKLSRGTVSAWKRRGMPDIVPTATQKRRDAIGELLLELLEENVKALIAATRVMQDDGYLRNQNAVELGTMFGISYDKVIRMLEAYNASENDGDAS